MSILRIALLSAFIMALSSTFSEAQVFESRVAHGSGGSNSSNGTFHLKATFSQPLNGISMIPGTISYQGFWTPRFERSSRVELSTEDFSRNDLVLSAGTNPFSESTELTFAVPEDGDVSIVLYDALGRQIRKLIDQHENSGEGKLMLSTEGLASGHYTATISSRGERRSISLLVIK